MSTWRNLLTPNISKYIDSQNRENSFFNNVETPLNIALTSKSHRIPLITNSSKRIETSEFGDAKKMKYQENLDKIQKEIMALKKQNTSIDKDLMSSNRNEISNNENLFTSKEIPDFNEKSFVKKPNDLINYNFLKDNSHNKLKKSSFYERKKLTTNRKRNPSYLSLKDFNLSTDEIKHSKNLNTEFKRVEEQEEDLLSNNSVNFRTQSLDHLDYGINLTNLVKDLQEKLKKEIHLNEEVNKKLKKSNKEIGHLRSHITKLEKEFDLMKNQISIVSPNSENKLMKIYELTTHNKEEKKKNEEKIKKECEETIQDLRTTKGELLDALEKILQMYTSNKEKESTLFNSQSKIENYLQKFKLTQKKFQKKKISIAKLAHNYDLPLQSNSNSKCSSLKEKGSKNSPSVQLEGKENANTNVKMETSNNLVYTPSNFESLSFFENLKESKNSKQP